jgi:polar amino acid transport system substrate-binding protein
MEFDSIITAVSTGKADMGLAGMTVTEERKKNVNFSDSYATGIQVVIVPEGSDIKTVDDLYNGKKIGVQLSTTGDIYCCDDFGEENVEKYNKGNDAVMALVAGKIDAVVIDNEPAKSYVAANEGLVILDTDYVTEEYAAALNKDNTALLEAINGALAELKADGTLDTIIGKYIPAQ